MARTQTTKRQTAQTKRSTAAKKTAGTRARTTARQASRPKSSAKRTTTQGSRAKATARRTRRSSLERAESLVARAEHVGAQVGNAVQTGVTAAAKAVADGARRVTKAL